MHNASSLEELRAIPKKGYCKHLTPEYWETKGYRRGWGDAAVCAFPDLEILRKIGNDQVSFLILNGKLRRPVIISFDKETGYADASY